MLTSVILEQNVLQKWNILFCGLYYHKRLKGVTCFSQQIDDLTIFFILFLQTERKKAKPSFRLPTFCWIFDQRVSTRVGQSASCFRFLLRDILGFPGYDEANSCGFDLITFCKPIGEYLLHSHRELGYGKVCLFGKELKAAVLHRNTALQCQHLVFDSLEGP